MTIDIDTKLTAWNQTQKGESPTSYELTGNLDDEYQTWPRQV